METLLSYGPILFSVIVAVLAYLSFKLYSESTKFIKEVQFFLDQKTLSYNKLNASHTILKGKMNQLERELVKMRNEKSRLGKSLKIMNQFVEEGHGELLQEERSHKVSQLQSDLQSVKNVLNKDLRLQLKSYSREVNWLSRRIEEIEGECSKLSGQKIEIKSQLKDLSLEDIT